MRLVTDRPDARDDAGAPAAPTAVRVLLAEDDEAARAVLVEALAAFGHEVVAAVAAADDAVAAAEAHAPDVVLLDVHLDGSSGLEAARAIAARLPGVAVLLYTGDHALQLTAEEVAATSAVSLLPKPTPPNALDAALRLAAARARALLAATREAEAAREALETRKAVERAKGIVMRRTGCGEQEAYRVLQRTAQDRATTMLEVARAVLAAEPAAGTAAPARGRGGRVRAVG